MQMIVFPEKLPGLKWLTIGWAIYGALWIIFEGGLSRAVLMGVWTTVIILAHIVQKYLSGARFSARRWLGIVALIGFGLGFVSGFMVLFFMAFKTGLHAHGPEFSPSELAWVMDQIPIWTTVGAVFGIGMGLLAIGATAE